MLQLLIKADNFLAALEKLLLSLFTGALAIILMVQVVLRYGFSRPLFWAEEVSVQFLVFMTLFGLSLLIKQQRMIAIDLIINALARKHRKALALLLQFIGLAVGGFFAYEATLWLLRPEVRLELSPTTQLPVWYNYAMLPLAFYGMTYHLAVGFLTMVTSFKTER